MRKDFFENYIELKDSKREIEHEINDIQTKLTDRSQYFKGDLHAEYIYEYLDLEQQLHELNNKLVYTKDMILECEGQIKAFFEKYPDVRQVNIGGKKAVLIDDGKIESYAIMR